MSETEFGRSFRQVGNAGGAAVDRTTNTVSDVGAKLGETASDAAARASAGMRDAIRDGARKVDDATSEIGGDLYKRSQYIGRDIARHIESQPMSSVIIAAAAGIFTGMLLARR
jgi:ElaB/YqjD/DUF883 family membrane-anchored ribosome-binding protein